MRFCQLTFITRRSRNHMNLFRSIRHNATFLRTEQVAFDNMRARREHHDTVSGLLVTSMIIRLLCGAMKPQFNLVLVGCLIAILSVGARAEDQRFLLDSQLDDGLWLVQSCSKAIQTDFESGFPHGEHQFISISGTNWATMALLAAVTDDKTTESPDVRLFKWERGIGVRSRDHPKMAMYLCFYLVWCVD